MLDKHPTSGAISPVSSFKQLKEHFGGILSLICISSFKYYLCRYIGNFKLVGCIFDCWSFEFSFYILWILNFCQMKAGKDSFSHSGVSLHLITYFLYCMEAFSFLRSHISTPGFKFQANGVLFRKSFPTTISYRVLHVFCSSLCFTLRSLINLELLLCGVI